jgi:hypothetical protein
MDIYLENKKRGKCSYHVILRRVRETIVAVEKQYLLHILRVGCLALGFKHVMLTRPIVICGMPGSAIFSTLPHKRHEFWKKLLNMKCVF